MISFNTIALDGRVLLAPMAGVTDAAFREICTQFGAAATVGEMTSAKGLVLGDREALNLVRAGASRPFGAQLFGNEPEFLSRAAEIILQEKPDFIDLNSGCPAPKIVTGGAGSALMKDLDLFGRSVEALVKVSTVPVTVKIRAGWDETSINAVEAAKIAQECGAAAITVHGRTRMQMYSPPVNLDIIREVKRAVSIPVIGNGDIFTPEDAQHMLDYTGCNYVMVGRGALGRPYIFRQINAYLKSGELSPPPTVAQRMDIMLRHISLMCKYKGERVAMLEARKHAAWYMKGLRGAAVLRRKAGELKTLSDLEQLAKEVVMNCVDGGDETQIKINNFT